MNILFRADSSSTIGTGHIMRDLVLAKKYANKGHNIIFATQDLEGNINNKILEAKYELNLLKSNNFEELDTLLKKQKIDFLVIDHYGINFKFEKKLKTKNLFLKILSFDDTYEKHYCDILLNHNISANKKKYKDLVPQNCEVRCGSKYTLLRDEFLDEKKRLGKRKLSFSKDNSIKKIFLAMGGADHSNINITILKVLNKFKGVKVDIVTTTANKNLDNLKKYCSRKTWIKLHVNSNKIAKLMAKCNFAIVTPSVTVNEVYYLNLPMIVIQTADNQKDMYTFLKNKGYLVLKNFKKEKFQKKIVNMMGKLDNDK